MYGTREGPIVVVTGGSAGIGLAIVERFADLDYQVISLARRRCPIDTVESVLVDLGNPEAVAAAIAQIHVRIDHNAAAGSQIAAAGGQAGRIRPRGSRTEPGASRTEPGASRTEPGAGRGPSRATIHLIHNAAVMPTDSALSVDAKLLERTLRLNVTTPAQIDAALIPRMRPGSSIVFIGSTLSDKGIPNRLSYVTSKHALLGLMRATVQDLFGTGIHCLCVAPGFTDTAMLAPGLSTPGFADAVRDMVSFGRLLEPEEIADLVVFATRTPALNGANVHANLGQRER
jgi:3-oxoacyl-[acyl-carrier protein] reductase